MLDAAGREYERAAKRYRTRKAAAEKNVTVWRWSTGPLYGIYPFEPECSSFARGRPLAKPPGAKKGKLENGFDSEGRLVVVRRWFTGKKPEGEEFFEWSGKDVVSVAYQGDDEVLNARVFALRGGVPKEMAMAADEITSTTRFGIERGLVAEIARRPSKGPAITFTVVRDKAQAVTRIDFAFDGRKGVVWKPPAGFDAGWLVRPGERSG